MSLQPTNASPQGIASLYMGNPGALQQKIQKDQQAKPGLPPDLKNLMALNIVTNEQDAAKRQQAMNALNSMAPMGQEPPTIAESIQEQAKQKMQAQMLQQQRQQQGLQALAKQQPGQGIPEGTQFAEAQPQGLDEIPVDMEFAGGGIVAFAVGDSVPRVRAPVGNPQAELIEFLRAMGLTPEEFTRSAPQVQNQLRDMFNASKPAPVAQAAQAAAPVAQAAEAAAPAAQAAAPAAQASGIKGLLSKALPALGRVAGWAPVAMHSSDLNANEDDQLAKRRMFGEQYPTGEAPATIRELVSNPDISAKQFAERAAAWQLQNAGRAPTAGKPPAAAPGTAPTAKPPVMQAPAAKPAMATPAESAPAQAPASGLDALQKKILEDRMKLDPDARAKAIEERAQAAYGAPDTSQYDRLVSELEGRRAQFEAPKAGFDAFAEYMGNIASQGPQRSWAAAGAKGAAAQRAMDLDRKTKQFELTKQMVETAQKKLDAERGYKKEIFGLTEKERDEVDKLVFEAAKEYNLNKRDQEKMAHDIILQKMRDKNALAVANVRSEGGENKQVSMAEAAFARDPNAKALAKTLEMLAMNPNSPTYQRALQQLNNIRASKYREFGLTLTEAPGAPQGPGGSTPPPNAVREVKR